MNVLNEEFMGNTWHIHRTNVMSFKAKNILIVSGHVIGKMPIYQLKHEFFLYTYTLICLNCLNNPTIMSRFVYGLKDFQYLLSSILHYSYISRLKNNLTKLSDYFKQFVGKLQITDELLDCV